MKELRYDADVLIKFATTLLSTAGLPKDRASTVAATLVEADLMGHTTHGLHLLSSYIDDLVAGKMTKEGEPEVINDAGAAVTWNGKYLPGIWLTHKALDLAFDRIAENPVVTVVIRKSHHIGCLAAYAERATERGLMMILSSSDPRSKTVAPFGGLEGVYSPNPIAAGIPTEGDPIIVDVSTSTTANGMVFRALDEGKKLAYPWLLDNKGNATNDPAEFLKTPPATVLPLGGLDSGYKGYALGILVEALTCGLSGYGRADDPDTWGASVFLQVINPEAFGGHKAFLHQNEFLANVCRTTKPVDNAKPVRMPGSRALQLRKEQRQKGVLLYSTIMPTLKKYAERYDIAVPMEKN